MFRKSIFSMVVIFILGSITFSLAQKDVQGSKDHPVISRYQGSYIIGYEQEGYDQLVLPLGPYDGDETKTITPDGKVTRILYAGPRGRSSLEVQQNYRLALQDASFEILYECSEDCQRLPDFFMEENKSWRIEETFRDILSAMIGPRTSDIFLPDSADRESCMQRFLLS